MKKNFFIIIIGISLLGYAAGDDASKISGSPFQQMNTAEFYAALKQYDETNYRDLLEIAPRERNPDRQAFVDEAIFEISQKSSSDEIKTNIAIFFLGRYLTLLGPMPWQKYLFELAAYLPQEDRGKVVETFVNVEDTSLFKNRLISFIGELNIHEAKPHLKEILKDHNPAYRTHILLPDRYWRIRIALAQMGEREYIDHCIEALNYIYQTDEDRFVRSRFLYYLDAISHIRQEETIAIIMRYCDDETVTSACIGQLAVVADASLHNLRASLYGFPLDDTAGDQLSPAQRTLCREWLKTTYSPRLIKSHSVLIDGKLYDNIADWQKGLIKIVDGKVVILDEPEGATPTASPETAHPVPAGDQGQ